MAEVTLNASVFHLFSSLPQELRDQIWREALPDEVGPALFFWKKGLWQTSHLTEADPDYIPPRPGDDDPNLVFRFRHELLDEIQFDVPLAFVNHEARHIALAWLHKQGIETRICKRTRSPIFIRSFDSHRDALYIPLDQEAEALWECSDRFDTDIAETLVSQQSDIRCVAVTQALLQSNQCLLEDLIGLGDFMNIRKLLVIINEPADLQFVDNDSEIQQRWEFKSTQGGSFIWDKNRGSFFFKGSRYNGDEALYGLMEEHTKRARECLARAGSISSFEVQPVFATKK